MSARPPWAALLTEFQVRSATSSDRARVAGFLAAMDREGLYQRHFAHGEAPNQALLARIDAADQVKRVALIALDRDDAVLGHGEYVVDRGGAEFAFMVLPQYRGCGIGGALLRALLETAAATGLTEIHGMIQAGNRRALQLVRRHGFRVVPGGEASVVIVSRDPRAGQETSRAPDADCYPPPFFRHDSDRTPLHRRPGPRASFRPGGG